PRSAGDRDRSADRDHARHGALLALRPRGLTLPQPPFTVSFTVSFGEAATRGRGRWATTRAVSEACSGASGDNPAARSRVRARASVSPTTFGTTPCSGFASTSVTVSNDESLPRRGNWSTTMSSRCFGLAGL